MLKVKQSSHYIAYIVPQRFFDRWFFSLFETFYTINSSNKYQSVWENDSWSNDRTYRYSSIINADSTDKRTETKNGWGREKSPFAK